MTRSEARQLRQRSQRKQRAVAGRGFAAEFTYGDDGDAVPAGAVTVEVFSSAGESLSTLTASRVGMTDTYSATIGVDALLSVDLLTLVWNALIDGDVWEDITTLDVCGSRLFTIGDMRRMPDMADPTKYPNAAIETERIAAEDYLEAQCCRAFAVRVHEAKIDQAEWYLTSGLTLPTPDALTLLALAIDGDEATPETLEAYSVGSGNVVYAPDEFVNVNVDVMYVHGAITPDAGRVAAILARHRLTHGPLDDRAVSLAVDGGGTIALLTPGVRGSLTGIPEVDVFISRYA